MPDYHDSAQITVTPLEPCPVCDADAMPVKVWVEITDTCEGPIDDFDFVVAGG